MINIYSKLKYITALVAVLIVFAGQAWGQVCTAIVDGGDWNDRSTWSCGIVPENWHEVSIGEDFTIYASSNINHGAEVTINGALISTVNVSFGYGGADMGPNSSLQVGGNLSIEAAVNVGISSNINVNGNLNMSGGTSLNLGNNTNVTIQGDADFKGGTIESGAEMRVFGSMEHSQGNLDIYGTVVVENNFLCTSGNGFTIYPSGKLILKGDSEFRSIGDIDVQGELLVSGDLDYTNSGAFNITSPGHAAVGGDMNIGSTNMNIGSDTELIVLGNFTGNNGNTTIDGNIIVIGEIDVPGSFSGDINNCMDCISANDCPAGCPIEGSIPGSHPIWNVTEGINTIYFEGFDGEPNEYFEYENTGSENSSDQLFISPNIEVECFNRVRVSANIWVTGDGDITYRYSVDGGSTWLPSNTIPLTNPSIGRYERDFIDVPSSQIMLEILVENLTPVSSVIIDNILVRGTNEGGEPLLPITWISFDDEICPVDRGYYEIDNDGSYTDVVWTIESGTGTIISSDNSSCVVEWETLPGRLRVSVEGGGCGGVLGSSFSEIEVVQTEALTVSYEKNDISCHGEPYDGSITIEARCGPAGEVSYAWTVPTGQDDPGNVATANNLRPGNYTVLVTKGADTETLNIAISQPAALNVSYADGTKAYICTGGDDVATIAVNVSGGTEPYNEPLLYRNGLLYSGSSIWQQTGYLFEIEDISSGTYLVVLTDANGCNFETEELEVFIDNEPPTFDFFPSNVHMTMEEYHDFLAFEENTFVFDPTGSTLNSGNAEVTHTNNSIDGSYHNFVLNFNVSQSGASPSDGDVLLVEVSYGGSGDWETAGSFSNTVDGLQSIELGEAADGHAEIDLRYTATIVTSSLTYNISNVQVSGRRFPEDLGGGLPTCIDNSGVCTLSFTDSEPTWIGECISYEDGEFYIARTWVATDPCGQSAQRIQYISVGEAPEFDPELFPADAIFNFCYLSQNITAPTAADGCGAVVISWTLYDDEGEIVEESAVDYESAALVSFTFPEPGIEYSIVWTATDEAHIPVSRTQLVEILAPIDVEFSAVPVLGTDICLEDEVIFTLTVSGGTGTYTDFDFSPSGGDWVPASNTYTTTGLTDVLNALSVSLSDVTATVSGVEVTEGCTSEVITSQAFIVHDLIQTNTIERDD